jgi:hypothetical protein
MTDTTPTPNKKSAARFVTPVLVIVAALGIGVVGGVLVGQNTASTSQAAGMGSRPDGATGDAPAGGFGGGAGAGAGFTSGTVTAVDGDTVTLELDDGSTVTVTTTDDTTVTTTDEASVSDLAEGDSLTVVGDADDDGNVAATSISEGAAGFGGMGGATPPTDESTD